MKHSKLDHVTGEQLWNTASKRFVTDREFVTRLPTREHETVYVGSDAIPGRQAACALGQKILALRFMQFGQSATTVLLEPDWGLITIPIAIKGPMRVNGADFVPGEIFAWNRSDEYVGAGTNRHKITVGYRKTAMCATLSALAGTEITVDMLPSHILQIFPNARQDLLDFMLGLLAEAFQLESSNSGFFNMTPYQETRLFSIVAQLVFHNSQNEARTRPATSNALRVVEMALEPFNDSQTIPTVADLCAASGVGVTWLHQCFQEIYGTSPAQFILNKRLSAARERFLDFDSPPRSVKDVALALGFVGPGRFAQYYRRAFGELPGETFRRAGHR